MELRVEVCSQVQIKLLKPNWLRTVRGVAQCTSCSFPSPLPELKRGLVPWHDASPTGPEQNASEAEGR